MNRRRKRRLPFAAYGALIFNASICLAPFIGAHAIANAYGDMRPDYETTSDALAATRQAIDARLERLTATGDGPPREVWTAFVRNEVEAGDITMARGLLLAAPAMLRGPDGEALKARIAVSDASGEQALVDAALAYLPDDVQDAYERRTASVVSLFDNTSTPELTETPQAAAGPAAFSVLGDLRDLSLQAARWVREDRLDEFAFILSGLGLTLADGPASEGASVLLSARRAQRLDPAFELYIERKLYLAAPPQRVKRLLVGEFQNEFGYGAKGPAVVEAAFRDSADRLALEDLLADLRVIGDIARDTSPSSAVAILSRVEDGPDLKRARLVAQAGGDKAVALAQYDGERLLDAARTPIRWNNALRLQLLGLVGCFGLLGFIALSVLWRSFRRNAPVRRSAVYALEEVLPH